MFGFLKKKIKEFIIGVKEEVVEEAKKEEQELKTELKETKKEIEEVKEEIKELKEEEKEAQEPEEKLEAKKAELEEIEEEKELEEKKGGLFSRLKKVFVAKKISADEFEEFFNKLELILIENNVAIAAIDALRTSLKKELVGKEIKRKDFDKEIENALKKALSLLLLEPFDMIDKIKNSQKPFVIVFFGINGSGKTTTIAKIAYMLKKNQLTTVLAAADTFRAASIEQLEKHGKSLGIEVIKQKYGADPAAVAFDAVAHAKAKAIDVVLIDTAGRMHTKSDLLREMEKICRVTKPSLKIFVGEAITGNDAVEQAKAFSEAVGIDAIILTKADVDEKGGATISVSHVTNKPILFLGTGQKYNDLKKFDKKEILEKIFS